MSEFESIKVNNINELTPNNGVFIEGTTMKNHSIESSNLNITTATINATVGNMNVTNLNTTNFISTTSTTQNITVNDLSSNGVVFTDSNKKLVNVPLNNGEVLSGNDLDAPSVKSFVGSNGITISSDQININISIDNLSVPSVGGLNVNSNGFVALKDDNDISTIKIMGPISTSASSNYTFRLPPDTGTSNYVLWSDGIGGTFWGENMPAVDKIKVNTIQEDILGNGVSIISNTNVTKNMNIMGTLNANIGSFTNVNTDTLNISGTTTLTGLLNADGGIQTTNVNTDTLNVTGVTTLTGLLNADGGIQTTNVNTDTLNVTGVTTLTGLLNANVGSFTNVNTDTLNVTGVTTLTGLLNADGGIQTTNVNTDTLNVTGVITLTGLLNANVGSFNDMNTNTLSALVGSDIMINSNIKVDHIMENTTNNGTQINDLKIISNKLIPNGQPTDDLYISNVKYNGGNITTTGNVTMDGNFTINGNIIQRGFVYNTHTEQLFTSKDMIFTRENAISGLLPAEYTGIQAIKYDGTNDGQLVFGADGYARVGDVGQLQILATREDVPNNKGIAYFDDTTKKFMTMPKLTANVATKTDSSGYIISSSVTNTELEYVSGVTSSIQTQLNNKEQILPLTINTGPFLKYITSNVRQWEAVTADDVNLGATDNVTFNSINANVGIQTNNGSFTNVNTDTLNVTGITTLTGTLNANIGLFTNVNTNALDVAGDTTLIGLRANIINIGNDYDGGVSTYEINNGGLDYQVDDVVIIDDGIDCLMSVSEISITGSVTSINIFTPGNSYNTGIHDTSPSIYPCHGNGLKIDITSTKSYSIKSTYDKNKIIAINDAKINTIILNEEATGLLKINDGITISDDTLTVNTLTCNLITTTNINTGELTTTELTTTELKTTRINITDGATINMIDTLPDTTMRIGTINASEIRIGSLYGASWVEGLLYATSGIHGNIIGDIDNETLKIGSSSTQIYIGNNASTIICNGNTSIIGTSSVTGILNAHGGIAVNTSKFTVDGATGDVNIGPNKFTVNNNSGETKITGILNVSGNTELHGPLTVYELLNAKGGLNIGIDGNKFIVRNDTGNTSIAGSLDVSGDVNVGEGKFIINNESGNTLIAGSLDVTNVNVSGPLNANGGINGTVGLSSANTGNFTNVNVSGSLNADGGIAVNSDKFIVNSISGDTTIYGILNVNGGINGTIGASSANTGNFTNVNVNGPLNADGGIVVNSDKFIVNSISGDTTINGILNVNGGINGTIGSSSANTGNFTNVNVSGILIVNGDINGAFNGAIGTSSANTGNFTNVNVSGPLNADGGIVVNSYKFIVNSISGDTTINGILNVNGGINGTVGSSSANTGNFTNVNVSGSLNADGDINGAFNGTIGTSSANTGNFTNVNVSGPLNVDGGIAVNSDKFIVNSISGETTINGTLNANGGINGTIGTSSANTGNFTNVNVSGILNVNGDINGGINGTIGTSSANTGNFTNVNVSGPLNADGGIAVNSDKFIVNSISGETTINGTLNANGEVNINTNKFMVNSLSGDATIVMNKQSGTIGVINSCSIYSNNVGSMYQVNDMITIVGGSNTGTIKVNSVQGGVATSVLTTGGTFYKGDRFSTTSNTGIGTGLMIYPQISSGVITGISIASFGTNYAVNDTFIVDGGDNNCECTVLVVGDNGRVTSVSINTNKGGTSYALGQFATYNEIGSGSGFVISCSLPEYGPIPPGYSVYKAGINYHVDDIVIVKGIYNDAKIRITGTNTGVGSFELVNPGYDYMTGIKETISNTGSGLRVNVVAPNDPRNIIFTNGSKTITDRFISNPATNNTFIGENSGNFAVTGSDNTCLGSNAGSSITSGINNIMLGSGAGNTVTTASNGIYIGTTQTDMYLPDGINIDSTNVNTTMSIGSTKTNVVNIGRTSSIINILGGTKLIGPLNADGGIYGAFNGTIGTSSANTGNFTNVNVSGPLNADGGIYGAFNGTIGISSANTGNFTNVNVSGPLNANGGIVVNSDKFIVNSISGDTTINGILNVNGGINGTIGTSSANTGNFTNVNVSGPLNADGGIVVNNDKFTVNSISGDTTINGILNVNGGINGTIGTSSANIGNFTNVNVSGPLNADGGIYGAFNGTIGLTTQNIGNFTYVNVSGGIDTIEASSILNIGSTKANVVNVGNASSNTTILGTNNLTPPGSIMMYAGEVAQAGWLLCDGTSKSRETYSALFNVIGTIYGAGDGSLTFNIPNLQGNVPVGKSNVTPFNALNNTGGEQTHTLTTQEMPSHNHDVTDNGHRHPIYIFNGSAGVGVSLTPAEYSLNTSDTSATATTGISIQNKGGDLAHNNLQPYIVLNYIIKY
jgi:microcystin-dependent protein